MNSQDVYKNFGKFLNEEGVNKTFNRTEISK